VNYRTYRRDPNTGRLVLEELLEGKVGARNGKEQWWDKAYYNESLEIAKATGSALLAVITIVRNRWQQGRGKPVALGNVALGRLGFDRRAKDGALRKLEKAGFVEVLRVGGSSPKITVLKEF
jgi:hypothetical protein